MVSSDGHDKPFCTKAITIIDNFKKALGDTDKSQFFKAISVIDKLSPINFSDKCCGKFAMRLTKFFLQVTLQKCVSKFFKKREQFTDSAVALNKTKRGVFELHFFQCINSLTLNTVDLLRAQRIVYRDNLSTVTKYITKAISVIDKSKLF